jgi:hypothetical protein
VRGGSRTNAKLAGACLGGIAFIMLATHAAGAQLLLDEHFSGASLNMNVWKLPDPGSGSFLGRTQLRLNQAPQIVDGVARLRLDTWNGGNSFLGSEIMTIQKYELGTGLAFETRSRLADPPPGLVGSLFTFEYFPASHTRDEIDVELLSNQVHNGQHQVMTNVFQNDGFNTGGLWQMHSVPGLDLTEFNTYRVEWRPNQIQWFVNGTLVRTQTSRIPTSSTNVRLNFWAPASDFSLAFNSALRPASSSGQNQTFFYEVDRVLIERLDAPPEPDPPQWGVNLLQAPGFEVSEGAPNASGGNVPTTNSPPGNPWLGWNPWVPNYTAWYSTAAPRSGEQGAFTFGNPGGIYQYVEMPETEGQPFVASGWFTNPSFDALSPGASVDLRVTFFDAPSDVGTNLGLFVSELTLTNASPHNIWIQLSVEGFVPDGAVSAQIMAFINAPGGGAMYIDDFLFMLRLWGDANDDGHVNIADLGILASHWQQEGVRWAQGDFNGDGVVNIADLGILAAHWQATANGGMSFADAVVMFDAIAGVVIPESASAGLLGVAGLLQLRRRQ